MRWILIVDPSAPARRALRVTLEESGYSALEAAGAPQAMAWLEKVIPALLICALEMVPMNGLALCAEVRRRLPAERIPLLLRTAALDDALKAEGRDVGVTGWLVGPIDEKSTPSAVALALATSDLDAWSDEPC